MARFEITAPDGRKFEVNAPEGATQDQVMAYVRQQTAPRVTAQPDAIDESARRAMQPTPLERHGRGFADIMQGIKQAALYGGEKIGLVDEGSTAAYTREKTDELRRYEQGRGPDAGIDWMRLGGNVAATAPVALIPGGAAAGLGTRIAAGAVQGGLATGAMFTEEGGSKAGQVATGAIFGALAPAAIEGIRRGFANVVSRFTPPPGGGNVNQQLTGQLQIELQKQGIDFNALTNDVKNSLIADAREALRVGGKLDPAMLGRKADIEAVGATPFKAALTRNPRDWQTWMNLRAIPGAGDAVLGVTQKNAEALVKRGEDLSKGTLGARMTRGEIGSKVTDALSWAEREAQDKVGAIYRQMDQKFGGAMAVKPDALLKTMDDLSVRFDADPIVGSINRYLKKRATDGILSGRDSEELRKLIRDVTWSGSKSARQMGNELIEALDDDVFSGFAGSPFATAREAAKKKFQDFAARPIQQVLGGKISAEAIPDAIVRSPIADLKATMKQLDGETINALRRSVVDGLLLKATGATSIDDIAARGQFSGRNFDKALEAIEPEKLHALFNPREVAALRQLQRASKALTEDVPFSDWNKSRTAAALSVIMQKIGSSPILNAVAQTIKGAAQLKGAMRASPVVPNPVAVKLPPPPEFTRAIPAAAGAVAYEEL